MKVISFMIKTMMRRIKINLNAMLQSDAVQRTNISVFNETFDFPQYRGREFFDTNNTRGSTGLYSFVCDVVNLETKERSSRFRRQMAESSFPAGSLIQCVGNTRSTKVSQGAKIYHQFPYSWLILQFHCHILVISYFVSYYLKLLSKSWQSQLRYGKHL